MNRRILIIIPAYNEQDNIISVVERLKQSVPQADYLIVDDCSNDGTAGICKSQGYHYLSLPINLGIGGGVQAEYKYALQNGYDIAVQHDGDGQHDPRYINAAIAPITDGSADIVIGSRFLVQGGGGFRSTAARRMGIRMLSGLVRFCCGTQVKDVTSGFRAVGREYIRFYAQEYPSDYPEPEAIVLASLNGARIREIPVVMHERENGSSSIDLKKSVYYMIKVSIAIFMCRLTGRRN